jgi:hypothetical protein
MIVDRTERFMVSMTPIRIAAIKKANRQYSIND